MKMNAHWILAGLLTATIGCGETASTKDGGVAAPLEVTLAGDAKADGSAFSNYQGSIGIDDRHSAWLPRLTAYHLWTFQADAGSEIFVDVPSRDGDDMYAQLYRETPGGWVYEQSNDDCGSGTLNSCISLTTDGSRYLVLATTYDYAMLGTATSATYEIEAMCAGGPCAVPPPRACGSRGLAPCPGDQYCDWPDANICGQADGPGVCAPIPDACPENIDWVCGCDGQSYTNACSAALIGVDTIHDGACAPIGNAEGEICGGIAGFQCADGLRCDYSANQGCYIADAAGVCVVDEPVVCTAQYDPVCGCDGRTYSNACALGASGVSFDHDGECQ